MPMFLVTLWVGMRIATYPGDDAGIEPPKFLKDAQVASTAKWGSHSGDIDDNVGGSADPRSANDNAIIARQRNWLSSGHFRNSYSQGGSTPLNLHINAGGSDVNFAAGKGANKHKSAAQLANNIPADMLGKSAQEGPALQSLLAPYLPAQLLAPAGQAGQAYKRQRDNSSAKNKRRLSLYGYAFWRASENSSLAAGALAPAAQYGGSQIGLNAHYFLGDNKTDPAISVRANVDADGFDQPELALGARWRPIAKLPISVTLERRLRENSPDSIAGFVAGGFDNVALPMKFDLSAFGQAGVNRSDSAITGFGRVQHFYDANLRADRKVTNITGNSKNEASLRMGAAAWAGGQSGVSRLDVGPTASVQMAIGEVNFRLSADYRVRVSGNAAPGNGAAVTISTSY